jgi:hypothetical protein
MHTYDAFLTRGLNHGYIRLALCNIFIWQQGYVLNGNLVKLRNIRLLGLRFKQKWLDMQMFGGPVYLYIVSTAVIVIALCVHGSSLCTHLYDHLFIHVLINPILFILPLSTCPLICLLLYSIVCTRTITLSFTVPDSLTQFIRAPAQFTLPFSYLNHPLNTLVRSCIQTARCLL